MRYLLLALLLVPFMAIHAATPTRFPSGGNSLLDGIYFDDGEFLTVDDVGKGPIGSPNVLARGASFHNTSTVTLDRVEFALNTVGTPAGTAEARLYAHSGTYGTSSVPTGSPLATSDAFSISAITGTNALHTLTFSGANRVTLTANTKYCIVFVYTQGSLTNYIGISYGVGTHAGNGFSTAINLSSWAANPPFVGAEYYFYVYGENGGGQRVGNPNHTGTPTHF